MSQPTLDESDNDYRPVPSHAYNYLLATCVSSTTALLLCAFEFAGFVSVGRGVFAILAAAVCVTFVGYLVRSAQADLIRRERERADIDADRFRRIVEDVYSVAFTDVVAGTTPPRRIDSMNGRSRSRQTP